MPKTKKRFDWEVYDEDDEFVDVISMTRDEAREYLKKFPKYSLQEISYTE